MLSFVAQRLLQSILVMLTVALIAFALFNYVERLGLNDPFIVQFGRFVANAVRGEFGFSYQHRRKVSELIAERMPATLELSLVSAILALIVGIPMGVYTALRRTGFVSRAFMTLSLVGISLPTFLIGILLILVFGVILRWLPTFGRGDVVQIGSWTTGFLTGSGLKSIIMPAITLALFQMTLIMRLVRAEMLEVLRTDFVKFGKARGLTDRYVYFTMALKNTLVPVLTITGLQLGSIIAFAIITESVFQWPGMGLMFIQAIREVDIPVMAARRYSLLYGRSAFAGGSCHREWLLIT